eukprot:scaffold117218_cov19-Prasinocladus_malaysianus.AAC.1
MLSGPKHDARRPGITTITFIMICYSFQPICSSSGRIRTAAVIPLPILRLAVYVKAMGGKQRTEH